jgi:outer membrane protein assembly factor BamD
MYKSGLIKTLLPLLCVAAAALASCGGSSQTITGDTAEARFKRGMAALEDKDYQKAQTEFNTIILQDPASEYADDAQYYLAESYFLDGDYKLAAFNYNKLRTSFPNSSFNKSALFRSGEAYYYSSLSYDRDQRETRYAIDVFKGFAQIYATDSLADTARARVKELRSKLAEREYRTAELYWKMEDYKSALIYYDRVIDQFPDTEYFDLASAGKLKAQREIGEKEALDTHQP